MISNPLISVIVPTFNHSAFLERSVSSVLAQTYPHFEVIIVDDGSQDDTPALVSSRWTAESRVSYFRQENKGLGAARNKGLSSSSGEFVQLLDSDDSIAAGKFESQVRAFEEDKDADIVYSDYANLGGDKNHVGEVACPLARGESPLSRLIRENFMPVHSSLIRRQVFDKEGGFDESRVALEDWDLWLRLACRGYKFSYLPGVFAYYHHDGSTMTSNPEWMYQKIKHLLDKYLADPTFVQLGEDVVREFSFHQNFALATRSYNQQRWSRAIDHLLKAMTAKRKVADGGMWLLLLKAFAHQLLDERNSVKS